MMKSRSDPATVAAIRSFFTSGKWRPRFRHELPRQAEELIGYLCRSGFVASEGQHKDTRLTIYSVTPKGRSYVEWTK